MVDIFENKQRTSINVIRPNDVKKNYLFKNNSFGFFQ